MIEAGPSAAPVFVWKNASQYTPRSRGTAPADLEPRNGLGLGLRLGRDSGYSLGRRASLKFTINDLQEVLCRTDLHLGRAMGEGFSTHRTRHSSCARWWHLCSAPPRPSRGAAVVMDTRTTPLTLVFVRSFVLCHFDPSSCSLTFLFLFF